MVYSFPNKHFKGFNANKALILIYIMQIFLLRMRDRRKKCNDRFCLYFRLMFDGE